jgi:hypothetical protein
MVNVPRLVTRATLASAFAVALGLSGCGDMDEQDTPGSGTTAAALPTSTSAAGGVAVTNAAARRFVDAVNSGSTDQVMATLSGDAVVIDSGRRFADAQSIRDWVDAEVTGVDGRITVRTEQPAADGTELRVDFQSSGFNGTDLRYRFTTRGDLITNLTLG